MSAVTWSAASAAVGACLGWMLSGGGAPAADAARCEPAAVVAGLAVPGDAAVRSVRVDTVSSLPSRPAAAGGTQATDAALADELLQRIAIAGPDAEAGTAAFERLRSGAQSDASLRHVLAQRLQRERGGPAADTLARLIADFPPHEVQALASQLGHGDAGQRANAYRLMALAPGDSGHALIQQALATEQDVQALRQAVGALGTQPLLDPQRSQATLARLEVLAGHADPAVRGESLRALAQWDKSGDIAERQLLHAMSAGDAEWRADAARALVGSGLKSEPLKATLLRMAADTAESADARTSALHALERFALTPEEYAMHARMRMALERPAGGASMQATEGGAAFSPFGRF